MQWHPNTDIDFYLTIVDARPEVVRPHVVVVFDKGQAVAMAVARVEDIWIPCTVGYKTLFSLPARSLTLLHGGVLGDERYSKWLVEALHRGMREGEVDVLVLSQMRCDSLFWGEAKKGLPGLPVHRVGPLSAHWQLGLSKSFERFLGDLKSKRRRNLLHPQKLLKQDYPGCVETDCLTDLADVPRISRDAEAIASRTYHRGLGVGFHDDDEHARRLRLEAKNGWLRAYFLYLDGVPVAFWLCTLYRNTLYLNSTGFCPEYSRYNPGTMLLLQAISDACSSDEVSSLDFGAGEAHYKRQIGDTTWEEETLRVYAARPRGYGLYFSSALPYLAEKAARWLTKSLGLEKRLKRIWRNRLMRGEREEKA